MSTHYLRNTTVTAVVMVLLAALGASPLQAQSRAEVEQVEMMTRFINLLSTYLDVADHWVEMLSQREKAIYLAAEGIKELYENKGNKLDAVPHLRKIAQRYPGNRVIQAVIHFEIRDIYKDSGQPDKALEELEKVIDLYAGR